MSAHTSSQNEDKRPAPGPQPPAVPGDILDALRKRARTSRKVSWLLDECVRIPGTNIRFGLDPILGLVPYGGETVATIIGTVILGEAGRKGLPIKTLVRMGGNMILNAGLGAIPIVGDLFSFWFKSNSRNYRMLDAYLQSDHGNEAPGGWWPLLLIIGVAGIVFFLNLIAWILLGGLIWKMSQGIEALLPL